MRIAILSDIHANMPALEAVVEDAREHGATHMICLGDIVGYGPQPVETLARVRELSNGTVLGNHDAAACGLLDTQRFNPFARETAERAAMALSAEDKAWLRDLPYIIEGDRIAFAHSGFYAPECFHYLDNKKDAAASLSAMPDTRVLFVGHTHAQCLFVQDTPNGPVRKLPPEDISLKPGCRYVINPGTVGFPRGERLTADYIVYDTTTQRILFRSLYYDLAPYRLALVRNGYNPMNYWFLSPSARRRQTEQALLHPTHASTFLNADSPFRAHRVTSAHKQMLRIVIVLFSFLLVGVIAFAILTTRTPLPLVSVNPANSLIPPFSEWGHPPTIQTSGDGAKLTFAPETKTLLSPRINLPQPCPEAFRFRFEVEGPEDAQKLKRKRYQTRAIFFCEHGKTKYDKPHPYKKFGTQEYTIKPPQEAVALRIEYTFYLDTPFHVKLPHLEIKK